MLIRTQAADKLLRFGEAHIAYNGKGGYGVYVQSRYKGESVAAGNYPDEARAKGVLYEAALAHEQGTKVFYMPVE